MFRLVINLLDTLGVLPAKGESARAAWRMRFGPLAMSQALVRLRDATSDSLRDRTIDLETGVAGRVTGPEPLPMSWMIQTLVAAMICFGSRCFFAGAAQTPPEVLPASQTSAVPSARQLGWSVHAWSASGGLGQDTVTAIAQSDEGYVWLATRAGLARFDGVRFKHFGVEDGLPTLAIRTIADDRAGGLWIGTFGAGLVHWNRGKVLRRTTEQGLSSDDIYALDVNGPGRVWIGTGHGLQHLGPAGLSRVQLPATSSANIDVPIEIVRAIAAVSDSEVWFAVDNQGLHHLKDGNCRKIDMPSGFEEIDPVALLLDRHGKLWASIGNGLILRREGDAWMKFSEADGVPYYVVSQLAETHDGTVWAGSAEAGLYALVNGRFERAVGVGTSIRNLSATADGVLWVGTESSGLYRLDRSRVFSHTVGSGDDVGQLRGLAEDDDGTIWVATRGGGLQHGPLSSLVPVANLPEVKYAPFVQACFRDRAGTMYFVAPRYIGRRSVSDQEWTITRVADANITSICEGEDGAMYVGGRDGRLRVFDGQAWNPVPGAEVHSPITCLSAGKDSDLWIGGMSGLWRWRGGVLSKLEGLPVVHVNAIYCENDGTLWVGTNGGGLVRVGEQCRYTTITSSNGLPSNVICAIVEDDGGCLWLGTVRGIARVSKDKIKSITDSRAALQVLVIDDYDGMPSVECTTGYSPAGLKTRTGSILMSTSRHIIEVCPDQIRDTPVVPSVVVESVAVDGRPQPLDTLPLTVKPGAAEVSFAYTALGARKPLRTRFRYRLVGLNDEWRNAQEQRDIRFVWLAPGRYTFELSASDDLGMWGTPAAIPFVVAPFYWQTAWFRVGGVSLAVLALVSGTWAIARVRHAVKYERDKAHRAEAQAGQHRDEAAHLFRVATLGRLATSFAHELNQPLTAIRSNAEVVRRIVQSGTFDRAQVLEAINDILADDRRATGIIQRIRSMLKRRPHTREPLDVNGLVRSSLATLAPELRAHAVHVSSELAEELPLFAGDEVQLQQVVINLIQNAAEAVWDLPAARREVHVSTECDAKEIRVHVSDTGSGLPPGMEERVFEPFFSSRKEGLGIGLSLCRAIVHSHGGRIWAHSAAVRGAEFVFALPIGRSSTP